MSELSPAAFAVVDAFVCAHARKSDPSSNADIAAVLRAAADQVIPITESPWGSTLVPVLSAEESRKKLLAIAEELEAQ